VRGFIVVPTAQEEPLEEAEETQMILLGADSIGRQADRRGRGVQSLKGPDSTGRHRSQDRERGSDQKGLNSSPHWFYLSPQPPKSPFDQKDPDSIPREREEKIIILKGFASWQKGALLFHFLNTQVRMKKKRGAGKSSRRCRVLPSPGLKRDPAVELGRRDNCKALRVAPGGRGSPR